jgi:signal transduction histidine kinase
MDKQVRKLNELVERLLDASRIQLGRLVLQKSRFNLADLAAAAASNIETGSGTDVRVRVHAPPEGAWGTWDVIRIEQVLTNLASNAVRYSPPGADVEIRIENGKQDVRVEVVDRGPGVPPEQRPALFNRYYQGANPSSAPHSGPLAVGGNSAQSNHKRGSLGLGLYISSEIVKAHGGAIGMDPDPEGGSNFWFTLPQDV